MKQTLNISLFLTLSNSKKTLKSLRHRSFDPQRDAKEMKMKCTHPENYGNDCNGDTCPTGDFEIMIALAEGTCDWGEWEKE